jgi:octaprenyl-diphosphate synthase
VNIIDQIQAPIKDEMRQFESHFKQAMKSDKMLLDRITHYIIKQKGKQMRPMFVFLSCKLCGPIKESAYTAASMIELLHTATLVHDDVVDDAGKRRGFFSINALWKNKIAVLVGDYLLARGLLISVESNQFELLRIMSRAVQEMSEGELLQQEKSRLLNITEEVYFEIISQKTASLIAACCESGAAAAGADEAARIKMRTFGLKAGLAFQIKDDLFDYGFEDVGKPLGIDIQERKLTLPLIHALSKADSSLRKEMMQVVKRHNTDHKKVRDLIQKVQHLGGMDYAYQKMLSLRDEALAILHEFEPSPANVALAQLVNYTVDRKK